MATKSVKTRSIYEFGKIMLTTCDVFETKSQTKSAQDRSRYRQAVNNHYTVITKAQKIYYSDLIESCAPTPRNHGRV